MTSSTDVIKTYNNDDVYFIYYANPIKAVIFRFF